MNDYLIGDGYSGVLCSKECLFEYAKKRMVVNLDHAIKRMPLEQLQKIVEKCVSIDMNDIESLVKYITNKLDENEYLERVKSRVEEYFSNYMTFNEAKSIIESYDEVVVGKDQ